MCKFSLNPQSQARVGLLRVTLRFSNPLRLIRQWKTQNRNCGRFGAVPLRALRIPHAYSHANAPNIKPSQLTPIALTLIFSPTIIFTLLLLACLWGLSFSQAHAQRLPQDGQNGIETTTPNAWLIQWSSHGESILYEYLITDNPICTKGCAGDTREGTTKATSHIEFNLKPNAWYYWTYRPILSDTLEGEWLDPYAFFTKPAEIPPYYFANKTLILDRQAFPNSRKFTAYFYNLHGQIILHTSWNIDGFERIHKQPFPNLNEGLYFLILSDEQQTLKPLKIWISP